MCEREEAVKQAGQQPNTAPSSTATCPPPTGGIEWKKQPGATDEDLAKAKKLWDDAKARRNPDGTKPATVEAMEALEKSDKKTVIEVGPTGNNANPDSRPDSQDPTKGSGSTIKFNPDKKGKMSDGTERDPESSLAHEAYHAYEYTQGTSAKTSEEREVAAAGVENEHRKAKGLPQRKKYGKWDIPQK